MEQALRKEKLNDEQNFEQFLISLGSKKIKSELIIVDNFKKSMFEYLLIQESEGGNRISPLFKIYIDQYNTALALKKITKRKHTDTLNTLKKYFQFLNLQGLVASEWSLICPSTKEPRKKRVQNLNNNKRANKIFYINGRKKKTFQQNEIFKEYIDQLSKRNAPCTHEHYSNIHYFLKFLNGIGINNLESLRYEHAKEYVEHLKLRVNLKEIKKTTGYIKLQKLKHFIAYLYQKKIIMFKFDIPPFFRGNKIKRDNEYVTNEDRLNLIKTIIKKDIGRHKLRDLAITLILVDVGCRPIEISNIRINDVNITESTITLYSVKSGQRVLKIDKFVMNQIEKYLEFRKTLPAETDHLFLLDYGAPVNTRSIGGIINGYNRLAFGETRFSAKSLRHTFITNALNDRNDIHKVAESAGHTHLISTLHYFYKSIELLLENTLPYNPVEGIDKIK